MKRLLLIDGHNLLFKMFFGMPFPFYNIDNCNITGTVGFVGTVIKMIKYLKADECLVVFDGENSRSLRESDENYKANRTTDYGSLNDDENPFSQLDYIKSTLDYLNICWVETKDCECDDYIALITKAYDGEIFISSTDTDFLQLVNDKVNVIKYKGKNTTIINEQFVKNNYLISPKNFALYKAMIGDKADNIKGINKVGHKTAVNIINAINNNEKNKFYSIYEDNLDLINHNLELIKLPNLNTRCDIIDFKMLNINQNILKNFKPLCIVNKVTTRIKKEER